MNWSEANEVIADAKSTMHRADKVIAELLHMAVGRLRIVGAMPGTLSALKRELRHWDIHRKSWRDDE